MKNTLAQVVLLLIASYIFVACDDNDNNTFSEKYRFYISPQCEMIESEYSIIENAMFDKFNTNNNTFEIEGPSTSSCNNQAATMTSEVATKLIDENWIGNYVIVIISNENNETLYYATVTNAEEL